MTNKNSKSASEEDHRNILTALALKKFVYNMNKDSKDESKYNIKICLQLIKPESKTLYFKSLNLPPINDQLIIVEEIKMNLLAKSCFAPGLISCISNLFASAGGINIDSFYEEWLKEYARGMGHEIYRVQISENDFTSSDLTFKKISEICFAEFCAVIFALEIEVKNTTKSIIRLNPSNFEFKDWINYNYYLYIICEDESLARKVQKLDMSDDLYEKHMHRPRLEKSKRDVNLKESMPMTQSLFQIKSSRRLNTIEADDEMRMFNTNFNSNPKDDNQISLLKSQKRLSSYNNKTPKPQCIGLLRLWNL